MSLGLKLALAPLLLAQALWARARVPRLPEPEGARSGIAGEQGPQLHLLIAGDSSAAGVGVATQQQALAGCLVRELSLRCPARWHWRLLARTGWTSAQLTEALVVEPAFACDLALLVSGVNDVVDQVSPRQALAARAASVERLRSRHGARHVLFCPVPPIGRFPGLPQPLRGLAGRDAQRHNDALQAWAAGCSDVSVVPIDPNALRPEVMARDGFHPGEPLYRAIAAGVAQQVALRLWPALASGAGAARSAGHESSSQLAAAQA